MTLTPAGIGSIWPCLMVGTISYVGDKCFEQQKKNSFEMILKVYVAHFSGCDYFH